MGDPVELAQYYSSGGADELVFLDIAATPEGSATMVQVVERVADVLEIPFTVGGGIRSVQDASRIIEAGADRVSLNSAALATPQLITEIAARFGSQAVVQGHNQPLAVFGDHRVQTLPDGHPVTSDVRQ